MTTLTAATLTLFRGCRPDRDCYDAHYELAAQDIENGSEEYPGEFAAAQAWALEDMP
jgi:hypothetical protein